MTGDLYTDNRMRGFLDTEDYFWNRPTVTVTCGHPWVKLYEAGEEGEDPDSLKARRRRFRAYLATVRKPEPEFLPPVRVKQEKRAVVRWGARSREQRERRKP